MRLSGAIFFLFVFCNAGHAQIKSRQISIDVHPIVSQNGKYYFNQQRVRFETLLLPLLSLNDTGINKNLRVINLLHDGGKLLTTGSLVYVLLSSGNQQQFSNNFYETRSIIIGTFVATLLLKATGALFRNKAIKRYNSIVLRPHAGVSWSDNVNVGLTIRF